MTYDTIIYHGGGCQDGFTAAWVAVRAGNEGAELIAANYGDIAPDVAGKEVLIVDFSYPRDVLLKMAGQADKLTVLDHHRTAQEALEGFADEAERSYGFPRPAIVFDMTKSGARLAWENFHGGESAPELVRYVEDRDLWKWDMAWSKQVNAAIRSYPMDLETFDRLHEQLQKNVQPLYNEGRGILRYQEQLVDDHVKNAVDVVIGGIKVQWVNATVLQSDIAGELAKNKPFGACFFIRQDGRRVVSLRSTSTGIDVSEIARQFSGGGHWHAAGYMEG